MAAEAIKRPLRIERIGDPGRPPPRLGQVFVARLHHTLAFGPPRRAGDDAYAIVLGRVGEGGDESVCAGHDAALDAVGPPHLGQSAEAPGHRVGARDEIGRRLALGAGPETVPSAWHFATFWLARMKLNLGEGRAIKASDRIDAEHYSASFYADVLVTDDRAFTETCKMIQDRPFRIETSPGDPATTPRADGLETEARGSDPSAARRDSVTR